MAPSTPVPDDLRPVLEVAAAHGIHLDGSSLQIDELGLDFRVVLAPDRQGTDWVLRIPRRPDVLERAAVEGRVLEVLQDRLGVQVPHWRVHTPELIAYPRLPGEPGLSVSAQGEVTWHLDMASPTYARSLGRLIAALHAVPAADLDGTGITHSTPEQVREGWHRDLERVAASFEIDPGLRASWQDWIAEDSYWPSHSVLTHGEIYPAHTLVQDDQVLAVLDWTTAAIGDPAKDLMFHRASAPADAFEQLLESYREHGGRTWPRLAEHCDLLFSTSPLTYALYALETGEDSHREAAAAALNAAA